MYPDGHSGLSFPHKFSQSADEDRFVETCSSRVHDCFSIACHSDQRYYHLGRSRYFARATRELRYAERTEPFTTATHACGLGNPKSELGERPSGRDPAVCGLRT